MEYKELLINGLNELGIPFNQNMIQQFEEYFDLLIKWNEVVNLTSITEEKEVIIKHFLDSLLVCRTIDLNQINNLIDIGTGAGFPGLPIKIVFPNIKVTLMDSLNKRIAFLEEVCKNLNIKGIECKHGRAEDLARVKGYRDSYDLVVSRAVSNLSTLSEYCLPFAKVSGKFIAYKSVNSEEEILQSKSAVHLLGGSNMKQQILKIPYSDIERTYVLIDKVRNTPSMYPRKAGTPAKNPL